MGADGDDHNVRYREKGGGNCSAVLWKGGESGNIDGDDCERGKGEGRGVKVAIFLLFGGKLRWAQKRRREPPPFSCPQVCTLCISVIYMHLYFILFIHILYMELYFNPR